MSLDAYATGPCKIPINILIFYQLAYKTQQSYKAMYDQDQWQLCKNTFKNQLAMMEVFLLLTYKIKLYFLFCKDK